MKPIINFDEFSIPKGLKVSIAAMGFERPTDVQSESIPWALKRRDLLVSAATGTGKTAAFGIPTVSHLLQNEKESALIVAPTRELASQIREVLGSLSASNKKLQMRPVLLTGGESMKKQINALRVKPRIVIGTPGRILDHIRSNRLKPRYYTTLVLDEADRMLDMGFRPQLEMIISSLPKERQTLLFSATYPKEIAKLARQYQSDPLRISITQENGKDHHSKDKIEQKLLHSDQRQKYDAILQELVDRKGSVIAFTRTKRRADRLSRFLSDYGHRVALVHGDRTQGQRKRAIEMFKKNKSRVLVATDVASRGLDIPQVEHVINFDLPQMAEDYVHRIGRTARGDATGSAISLVSPEERSTWAEIVRLRVGAPEDRETRSFEPQAKPARAKKRTPGNAKQSKRKRNRPKRGRTRRPRN